MSTDKRRRPTPERREQIVQAVLRIIGDDGFAALSTSRLAEDIHLTTGAIFRHFASREAILTETARYAFARVEATFPADDLAPAQRVLMLVRNQIRLMNSLPGLAWFVCSGQARLALPPEAAEWSRDLDSRTRRFLMTALQEGADAGDIRADIDAEVLVVPVVGTICALAGARVRALDRQQLDSIIDALAAMLAPVRGARRATRPPG